MKRWNLLALLILLATLLSACDLPMSMVGNADNAICIRIVTEQKKDSPVYRQLQLFADIVKERSGETISVKLYSGEEWSRPTYFMEYLTLNSVEMACLPATEMEKLVPEYDIYRQPYLFETENMVANYLSGAGAQGALQLIPSGTVGLGFLPAGYQYYAMGEVNGWLSYSEVKRLIGQQALGQTTLYDMRAIYDMQLLVMNEAWWDNLSEERKELITDAYTTATKTFFQQQREQSLKKTLLEEGVAFAEGAEPTMELICRSNLENYFMTHQNSITYYWRPYVEIQQSEEDSGNERKNSDY